MQERIETLPLTVGIVPTHTGIMEPRIEAHHFLYRGVRVRFPDGAIHLCLHGTRFDETQTVVFADPAKVTDIISELGTRDWNLGDRMHVVRQLINSNKVRYLREREVLGPNDCYIGMPTAQLYNQPVPSPHMIVQFELGAGLAAALVDLKAEYVPVACQEFETGLIHDLLGGKIDPVLGHELTVPADWRERYVSNYLTREARQHRL